MKKLTAVLLSLLMILAAVPACLLASADDSDTSGDLDENISWSVDKVERKLRITGTGDMPEMPEDGAPWRFNSDYIVNVEVCDGVTSISADAFADLEKLQKVEIHKDVAKIDGSAFAACPRLETFSVYSGNTAFYANEYNDTNGVLYNFDKTEIVRFPSARITSGSKDTTFTLPETVKKIGDRAFEGCTALTEIKFSAVGQLESIGEYAFLDCTSLKTFDCSEQPDISSIGDYAFSGCTALTTVRLWNSLKTVGTDAFSGCKKFSDFTFYGTKSEFGNLNVAIPEGSTTHFQNDGSKVYCYFIKYDFNGGTAADNNIGKAFEIITDGKDTVIGTDTDNSVDIKPEKDGLTFIGWSKNSKATAADSSYAPGTDYAAENGNLCLYAVYSTGWTLTFDANGGTGAPKAVTFSAKGNITIPSVTPSRSGYKFLGWSKSNDATTATYTAGGTIAVDSSVTLYAVWESTGPYDITYYNGTTLIATDKGVKTKNVDYTITRTAVKEPSSRYEFLGWATSDGSTTADYAVGSAYKDNDNITLYAVFQDNGPYDVYVHYDMENYNVCTKISQSSKGASVTVNVSPVAYDGWEFLGWSTEYYADSVDYAAYASFVPTSDVNLYPCVKMINVTEGTEFSFGGSSVTVNYRNRVNITAEADNLPEGYGIAVYDGRSLVTFAEADSDGHASLSYVTGELTSGVSYTVKVSKEGASAGESFTGSDGKVLAGKVTINVKDNIFLRIIAFFRGIFSSQPVQTI